MSAAQVVNDPFQRTNLPCVGCWWAEGGRCYNPIFGDVPRDQPLFSGRNGFEVTDAHLEACAVQRGEVRKAVVLARAGIRFL